MKTVIEDVLKFRRKLGLPVSRAPGLLDADGFSEQTGYMIEEVAEFCRAHRESDLVRAFDALLDLIVFAVGTGARMGLPMEDGWASVMRANMDKEPAKDSFKKVRKPPGWRGPEGELATALETKREYLHAVGEALGVAPGPEYEPPPPVLVPTGRLTLHETMIEMSFILASRALCSKRQVGCIVTDASGMIVSAGYNGRASGAPNCAGDRACEGSCEGIHAEANAMLRAAPGHRHTLYITTFPCWHCVKMLLNTELECIYIPMRGEQWDLEQKKGFDLWLSSGKKVSYAGGNPWLAR